MPTKLVLAGYFGCGNLGDDAVMSAFLTHLPDDIFDVVVLSGSPEETLRIYGAPAVPRREPKVVDKVIQEADCLVFPGGSIFQDVTSVRSVAYYAQLVKKAKAAGKPVVMLAQGVGPLNRFMGKRMAASAFNAADILTVRDPGSAQSLRELGVKKRVELTADMAFLLPRRAETEDRQSFSVGDMRTVGFAPRPFGKGKEVVQLFGELARLLFQANYMPVLIPMDKNQDEPLIQEIANHLGGKVPDLRKVANPTQMQQRLVRMDAVIAMRLHAGILAATVGTPSIMVSYDPKVAAFAKLMDLGVAPDMKGLTAQRLYERFIETQKDHERLAKKVEVKAGEMARLAMRNIELIQQVARPTAKM